MKLRQQEISFRWSKGFFLCSRLGRGKNSKILNKWLVLGLGLYKNLCSFSNFNDEPLMSCRPEMDYIIPRVPECLSLRRFGSPSPSSDCVPPPWNQKGGQHSLAGEGGSQFGRLERKPGTHACLLCGCAFDTFNAIKMKTSGREIIFIGVRWCQITWRPSLFPIGSLDEFLIPTGP
jgi:hypothetical protein